MTENWLGSEKPSNTVIDWGGSLAELENWRTSRTTAASPSICREAPTLQSGGGVLSGPGEEGSFDPANYTDLSNYYDYMAFVLDMGARSLYNTTSASADGESFLTLVGDSSTEGVRLCVTGRLVREDEDPALTATLSENENALLTGVQYATDGKSAPDRTSLIASQMERYTSLTGLRAGTGGSGTQNNGTASSSASTVLDDSLAELTQQTQDLIASADNLLAGLTDIAGQAGAAETDINQGAEGSLPEQSVSIDSIISGSSSSSAVSSEPASSSEGGSESVDSSSSESTSDPGTDSSAPSSSPPPIPAAPAPRHPPPSM